MLRLWGQRVAIAWSQQLVEEKKATGQCRVEGGVRDPAPALPQPERTLARAKACTVSKHLALKKEAWELVTSTVRFYVGSHSNPHNSRLPVKE